MVTQLIRRWSGHLPLFMLALALTTAGCALPLPSLANVPVTDDPNGTETTPSARVLVPTPTVASSNSVAATAVTSTPSALTPAQAQLLAALPSQGLAPALTNEIWFNSPPLNLAELQGKVVMVEFWTYGCINCRNVMPALQQWHTQYADEGLVIIGVHTPEFAFEKDLDNVQAALVELGVTWPVAIDNDWQTWRAYANHYWPAAYLIDKRGQIRLLKIGEGQYAYTESVIQALLAEPG